MYVYACNISKYVAIFNYYRELRQLLNITTPNAKTHLISGEATSPRYNVKQLYAQPNPTPRLTRAVYNHIGESAANVRIQPRAIGRAVTRTVFLLPKLVTEMAPSTAPISRPMYSNAATHEASVKVRGKGEPGTVSLAR